MNLKGDIDIIPLRRSERIRNQITNKIKNGFESSSTLRKMKRKGTIAASEGNKKTRPKQTTSLISEVPKELLVEILSRLPPKPFFRCRSVCKYWLSLSLEAFGRNNHLQPTVHGLFHNNNSDYSGSFAAFSYVSSGSYKVEGGDGIISALPCLDRIKVRDCCNGLVLISALSRRQPVIKEMYVYNPATQSLSALGSFSSFKKEGHTNPIFSLAFDTRTPSVLHLICFTGWVTNGQRQDSVEIISYDGGKWKRTQGQYLARNRTIIYNSKGTFLDGRVHRLTTQNQIVSIDPNLTSAEKEYKSNTQVISLPYLTNLTFAEIGESQGLLNCMTVCNSITLGIWVLKSYSRQEWTMKYQLSLNQIYSAPHLYKFDVCDQMKNEDNFAFHPQKDVLFMPLGLSRILIFDLRTGKKEELYKLSGNQSFGCWVYMPCYSI